MSCGLVHRACGLSSTVYGPASVKGYQGGWSRASRGRGVQYDVGWALVALRIPFRSHLHLTLASALPLG